MSLQPPDHFLLPAEDHLLPVSSQILEEKLVAVQDSTVVRATLLKEKSNVNHELVIMEVLVCKASKTYTYIEADRKGEEDPGPKPRQRPSLNSSPSSSSTSFPSRSGEPPLAKDEIRIPRRGNRDYNIRIQQLKEKEETHDVLATITLHHKMTVTRLFIMLKILHDSSPYYDIFKYQCYWFAKTLMIMIGDEFDGFLSDDENSKQAGKFRSLQITTEMECMAAASGILKQCRTAWKKKEDRALQAAAPLQLGNNPCAADERLIRTEEELVKREQELADEKAKHAKREQELADERARREQEHEQELAELREQIRQMTLDKMVMP